jgi:DNA-binding beta-propeller fold protein YncE
MAPVSCSPTWAQPSVDGAVVYVACNKADEIVAISRQSWAVAGRFKTGRGPCNLAVSPDGKYVVATLKQGGAVQVFDLAVKARVASVDVGQQAGGGLRSGRWSNDCARGEGIALFEPRSFSHGGTEQAEGR